MRRDAPADSAGKLAVKCQILRKAGGRLQPAYGCTVVLSSKQLTPPTAPAPALGGKTLTAQQMYNGETLFL